MVMAGEGFGIEEGAAELGRDAESVEEVGGDDGAGDEFGRTAAGEVEGGGAEDGYGFKGVRLLAPFDELADVEWEVGDAGEEFRGGLGDGDEAGGVAVGEGAEEDAIDDGEDGGVGADAEG